MLVQKALTTTMWELDRMQSAGHHLLAIIRIQLLPHQLTQRKNAQRAFIAELDLIALIQVIAPLVQVVQLYFSQTWAIDALRDSTAPQDHQFLFLAQPENTAQQIVLVQ